MKASSDGSLEPQTNHLVVDQSEASGKQGTAAHGMVTTIAPIRLNLVSFTNPLAAGSGLVERTPKKVGFSLWTLVVKKIFIAAGKLGTYSESSTHELSKNHIEK